MKFMKLGSKPDTFQAKGKDTKFVTGEGGSDITVHVGNVKFHLHKAVLLAKSSKMQKLMAARDGSNVGEDDVHLKDIPGGSAAFEVCAKFCYGMTVTLNARNVVAVRCAAEYLEMYESVDRGNLIFKIEVFLSSGIFRSWKDSIVALQTTKYHLPWSKNLKLIRHCIDSIASKAAMDPSDVDWSYSYNRRNLAGAGDGVFKQQTVPADWWVEDIAELELDVYKQVITAIGATRSVPARVVGDALKAYTYKNLPPASKIVDGDKAQQLVETVAWLLPDEKAAVSCSFLIKLLRAAAALGCDNVTKNDLVRHVGRQLEDAAVQDLLMPAPATATGDDKYDTETFRCIVQEFLAQKPKSNPAVAAAAIVDGYLAEAAKDANLPHAKFVELAEMMPGDARPVHDGLYYAVDAYLKEHPGLSKGEKKQLCGLVDCRRLSPDASAHAVQNDRLPLRMVVQVLFHEQSRAAVATAAAVPTRADSIGVSSYDSSRSAATAEDDWDGVPDAVAAAAADANNGGEKGGKKKAGKKTAAAKA